MRGRIYSDQKCLVCGKTLHHDDRRRGLFCKFHPDQEATKRFRVIFGRQVERRFRNYRLAERFLDGLRYEVDKGTFDSRDYKSDNPLGFSNLALKWLELKKTQVRPGTFKELQNYIKKGCKYWGDRNIKTIQYADLEDFLIDLKLSDKSKSNTKSCLNSFWSWLLKRKIIRSDQMPEFPVITFELGFRKTIDKSLQSKIIQEIKKISYSINPKIWLGVKMLSTYISIRPLELISIKEKDIDIKTGFIFIPHPKEKTPKLVPLIDEDIEILSKFPAGLPDLEFFRHMPGVIGTKAGTKFGARYLYKWWKKACANLGVEGVDLYGGTRHSSVIALTEFATPEQIRSGTMHTTNKAFERYYRVRKSDLKELYTMANQGYENDKRVSYQKSDTN